MAKQITTLSIFLASPSDVSNERGVVKEVINDLNQSYLKTLNLNFELLSWENSTFPSFGEYPQDVINKQIGDDYDIFLGILWSRFGTPTNKAESGTLEEFERANARRLKNKQLEICFYFKTDPIDPYKINFEQFQKIKNFKDSLPQLGGYYWEFNSSNFEEVLRKHLILICHNWISSQNQLKLNTITTEDISIYTEEDEEGFYDLLEGMIFLFKGITDDLQSFNDLTNSHNEMINHYTGQLDKYPDDFKTRKSIINETSDYMANYCEKVKKKFNSIETKFELALTKFNKFLEIYPEIHNKNNAIELTTMLNAFEHTIQAIPLMVNGNISFLDAVKQLPKMTTNLTRSKKLMISTLEPFIEYIKGLETKFLQIQQQGFMLLKDLDNAENIN